MVSKFKKSFIKDDAEDVVNPDFKEVVDAGFADVPEVERKELLETPAAPASETVGEFEEEVTIETGDAKVPERAEIKTQVVNEDLVEAAIPAIDIPKGYHGMSLAPKEGIRVYLSNSTREILCFWKKTRALENNKWLMSGKWCEAVSGQTIDFIPLYWREM